VKPNIEFLAGAGIECGQGVLTDAQLQTMSLELRSRDCAEALLMLGRHVVARFNPRGDQALCAAMTWRRLDAQVCEQINVLDTLAWFILSFETGGRDGWGPCGNARTIRTTIHPS